MKLGFAVIYRRMQLISTLQKKPEARWQRCLNRLPHSVKLPPLPAWKRVGDNNEPFPEHFLPISAVALPPPTCRPLSRANPPSYCPRTPSQSRRLGCLGQLGRADRVQLSYRKRNAQRHGAFKPSRLCLRELSDVTRHDKTPVHPFATHSGTMLQHPYQRTRSLPR